MSERGAAAAEIAALFDSLRASGRNDGAYCAAHAGALVLGAEAPRPIVAFAAQYKPPRPRRATTPLDHAAWLRHLCHPDHDPYTGKVFESVLAPVRKVRVQSVQKFGFSTRDAVSPVNSSVAVVRALGGAAFALGVPMPLVFLRPDRPEGLSHLPSEPIASVAGAACTSGRPLDELAFAAGHHMATYRADHYVRAMYGSAVELTTLFLAVLKIGKRDLPVSPSVESVVEELELLVGEDAACAELVRKVARLFVSRGEPVDIPRWARGVEHTALRAGLLLAGDLGAARRVVATLPDAPPDAMADLTAFAMSADYFALRHLTGIALWPDETAGRSPSTIPEPGPAAPTIVPPPPDTVASDLGDLRSVEISLDDLEAHDGTSRTERTPAPASRRPVAPASVPAPPAANPSAEHPLARAFRRYAASGANDRAFYVASVWIRREGAHAPSAVRELFGREQRRSSLVPRLRLGDAEWLDLLADPGECSAVGRLLAALAGPLRAALPRSPEDYGFDRQQGLTDAHPLARAVFTAAQAFGVPPPLVFTVDDRASIFARPPCEPALTLVNPETLRGAGAVELMFLVAEHVAYFRPERCARVLVHSPVPLAAVVRAVIEAHALGRPPGRGDPFVAAVLDALGRDPAALARVRDLAGGFAGVAACDEQVAAWCEAAERTAARAALLLACDLDAAARVLRRPERGAPTLVPPEAKLAALEDFAVSDAFARLRARLGL